MTGASGEFNFTHVSVPYWGAPQTTVGSEDSDSERIEYSEDRWSDADDGCEPKHILVASNPKLVRKRIKKIDGEIERIRSLPSMVTDPTGLMYSHDPQATSISPIHQLPEEMLSEIFLACVSDWDSSLMGAFPNTLDRRHPPWVFLSVCKTWRDLALRLPRIWSYIVIRLDTLRTELSVKITHLSTELMLSRSFEYPTLHINICGSGGMMHYDRLHKKHWVAILDALIEHSYRWKCVSFELARCFYKQLSAIKGEAPILTSFRGLATDNSYEEYEDKLGVSQATRFDGLAHCKKLSKVSLRGLSETPILPWSRITHYEATNEPLSVLKAIEKMPNLTNLKTWHRSSHTRPQPQHRSAADLQPAAWCYSSRTRPQIQHDSPTDSQPGAWCYSSPTRPQTQRRSAANLQPVTCAKLKHLDIPRDLQFLDNLVSPELEHLHVGYVETIESTISLITRSGCSLKSLEIKRLPNATEDGLRSIFQLTPELVSLDYSARLVRSLALGLLTEFASAASSIPLLPRLERLKFALPHSTDQSVVDALVAFVKSRREGHPNVALLKTLMLESRPYNLSKRLQPFIEQGLDVSIPLL